MGASASSAWSSRIKVSCTASTSRTYSSTTQQWRSCLAWGLSGMLRGLVSCDVRLLWLRSMYLATITVFFICTRHFHHVDALWCWLKPACTITALCVTVLASSDSRAAARTCMALTACMRAGADDDFSCVCVCHIHACTRPVCTYLLPAHWGVDVAQG